MTKKDPEIKLPGSNRPQRKHEPEPRPCTMNQREQQKSDGPRSVLCPHCPRPTQPPPPHPVPRQPGNCHCLRREVHRSRPRHPADQQIAPDMMVSFNATPAFSRDDNGYVISKRGKPPGATGDGPIFAQHILNVSNKAGDWSRPLHFKIKTAASRRRSATAPSLQPSSPTWTHHPRTQSQPKPSPGRRK